MKYLEVTFHTLPCNDIVNDVLSALCGDIGFESFMVTNEGLKAYIKEDDFYENALKDLISSFPIDHTTIVYEIVPQEDKDWNETWEKNSFQPILIDNRCVIHSPYHTDVPQVAYDILIQPQMAFGTGYHETTSLLISELMDADLKGKSLLDMGCGTSILAILASMRGANLLTAIDIDQWSVSNSKENIRLNHVQNITVELGDASSLEGRTPFDVIIANINRNILLNDMKHYVACMHAGSEIYLSGFYVQDIPYIRTEGEKLGLRFMYHKEKNDWAVVKMMKI